MSELYEWVLLLHVTSAVILLGTGVGTAFQLHAAYRSQDTRVLATVARHTIRADWWFTATSATVQPASGLALIVLGGWDPTTSWIVTGALLYTLAMMCWIRAAWLQYRIARLSAQSQRSTGLLPEEAHRAMHQWRCLGWPALGALLATLAMMVMKPALW